MPEKIKAKKLILAAARARKGSISPYSRFKVGAALVDQKPAR